MRHLPSWIVALGAWIVVAGAAGCRTERDQALRGEAAALVRSIRELRDAPNQVKRPRLKALGQLACSSEDLCELQRVCKKAYERHQLALDVTRTLRHSLGEDAGASDSTQSADLLQKARSDLERARFLARLCGDLEGKAARRYGL